MNYKKKSFILQRSKLIFLLITLVIPIISSCNNIGSETEVIPEIQSVEYVNKIFGIDRLEGFSDTTFAFSIKINFLSEFDKGSINRITLMPENNTLGLEWEFSDKSMMNVSKNSLTIANLIFPNLSYTYFTNLILTIEWQEGESSIFRFEYSGNFDEVRLTLQEWYDQETLRLKFNDTGHNIAVIDSIQVFWLENDIIASSFIFENETINQNVILIDQIPITATSFFIKSNYRSSDIVIESISSTYNLPDRIPPNVTFINEDLPNTNITDFEIAHHQNNKFFIITERSNGTLLVIDPINKKIDTSFELPGFVQSVAYTDSIIYIGYNRGEIEKIEIYSGKRGIFSTIEGYPEGMMITEKWLFVSSRFEPNKGLNSINLITGEIVHTSGFFGISTSDFVYSSLRKTGFTSRQTTLFGFKIDEISGRIIDGWQTKPSGNWLFSLYLSPDQSKILALNGHVITAGTEVSEIELIGSYDHYILSPLFDLQNDRLYSIRGINLPDDTRDLDIYRINDRAHLKQVLVYGDAYLITEEDHKLYILSIAGLEGNRIAISEFSYEELEATFKIRSETNYILPINFSN